MNFLITGVCMRVCDNTLPPNAKTDLLPEDDSAQINPDKTRRTDLVSEGNKLAEARSVCICRQTCCLATPQPNTRTYGRTYCTHTQTYVRVCTNNYEGEKGLENPEYTISFSFTVRYCSYGNGSSRSSWRWVVLLACSFGMRACSPLRCVTYSKQRIFGSCIRTDRQTDKKMLM